MVGTNPLSVAIPVADEGSDDEPVVLDMATGEISMGKVLDFAARGVPLPEGAAVDESGTPTTDAAAAARGAISPFGGPKGYALAVLLEVLVASLTGTALGRDVRGTLDPDDECTKGDLFVAVDPGACGAGDMGAVRDYLARLRAELPAAGHESVTVPGDRARATRAANLRDGVPVAELTWTRAHRLVTERSVQ